MIWGIDTYTSFQQRQEAQTYIADTAMQFRDPRLDGKQGAILYIQAPANPADAYASAVVDSDKENINAVIEQLKNRIKQRLGRSVREFEVEHGEPQSDSIDFIALVVITTKPILASLRMQLREELNRMISSSDSRTVRERIIVNFR